MKYVMVKRQPLSWGEWTLFCFRLVLAVVLHPKATYSYLRAMKIEGYYNPREFTQAFLLRLGHGARLYSLDPLRPREVARAVAKIQQAEPALDE